MNKKLKLTYLFMILLFMVGFLMACSGGEDDASGSGDSNDTESSEQSREESEGSEDSEAEDSGESEGDASASVDDFTLRFSTGTETGLYYPIGAVITDFWQNKIDGLSASSQASNGSVQNLIFMQEGEVEMALAMGNAVLEAWNGERGFEGMPYEDLRVIGHMYPNYTQWVIREGSGLESIGDIAGGEFGPGATGSGTDIASQEVLEAYDLTYEDMNIHHGGFPETTDMMRNNQIDMANIVVGIPGAAIGEMISTANGVLTSIDQEQLDYLTENYPYWFQSDIPAGTYDGQDNDVTTAAIANVMVVDASVPEEVVYEITKAMWESKAELEGSHEIFKQWKIEDVKKGIPEDIPFHDGAKKYYEEAGVW
ncbi:TAXI family TRAP transporter solute-binding subunit [Salinibacillus xinjiangensis]|uniref:TAXI family TRAP transporter solute-binding subunit n=1 Tax=Salinibacillus xinjiangensis TaxID=1229268 RepID=A0A6G1X1Y0_9BACI|nr:TAXI family TRAP transporter solute-binding subunit [Salinibacillus xinjiangensis]MRG84896.1 TAXI family TRAP transporter solute-binding subunit [Salinibacillus xinjiangensis]